MGTESVRLRGSTSARDPQRYPAEDEALGFALFAQVGAALKRGTPAPAAFIFFPDRIDRFSLNGLAGLPHRSRDRLISAMAGQDQVECMAMMGAFRFRGRGPLNGQWVASAFIEWPDNRWWTAWQPIGPTRELVGLDPQVRAAIDGSPRPNGVGGWFARARRHGLKLRVQREKAAVH